MRTPETHGLLGAGVTRRSVFGLAAGAAAAAGGLLAASPAHAAFRTGTWYVLQSRHSGLVLDIEGRSTSAGAMLVQWNRTDATNQQFRFLDAGGGYYEIQARHSNLLLDVSARSTANGADVVQWSATGGTNQQWRIVDDGTYLRFVNRNSGKALDVWERSTTAGDRISQYDDNGGANQQWRAIAVGAPPADGTPTIYIASDSTAQTYNSSRYPMTGWGQKLANYFDANTTVANHAIGGRSSRSFIEQGRLDTILDAIQPGDYLFVQFGHNDASSGNPERYTPPEDYKRYLRDDYMAGATARGATPVLLTPVSRRDYDSNGRFRVSFPDYVDKVYELVDETGVAMIDLSARSRAYLDAIGPEAAKDVFMHLSPGEYPAYPDGITDNTHFSDHGAEQMARIVSEGAAALSLPIADHVR
ncbi:RICIN domain-containing protein [Myceligenerans pegani]|uniref:RICIN domain-containing protein n=1 Tax=Myceligenerans pegani TaxID=2776917 RepID=A0ABR9N3F9_9MICO|nr:RICIN domain-containing protein [Myceligenerans sp. TRM 65318]MBE1878187.1 RICIN domain-containing protein [Myceligenerans sp. TRM 65318]MBE3020458.1 RICIN domain-containing protein [Myceligenerans sp. TRM 65318]